MRRSSPFARSISIDLSRNATDEDVARVFEDSYGPALGRLPSGRQVFHGLPFDLSDISPRRWVLLDEPVSIDLTGAGTASHLVVAHFCDTWRDDRGIRPPGLAVGHVVPVGEPLARYTIVDVNGDRQSRVVRRRFEINDGILGWGSTAFAAIPHLANEVLDWRGPHPFQEPGRYAAIGHSGSLTVMPGTYGTSQTGMTDFVPSSTDAALLWLHAIELDRRVEPAAMILEPLSGGRLGSHVVVAGVTLFDGSGNPLAREPRMEVRLEGLPVGSEATDRIQIDLGTVIRTRVAPDPPSSGLAPMSDGMPATALGVGRVIGWGSPRAETDVSAQVAVVVDLAIARDAVLTIADWKVSGSDLLLHREVRQPNGRRSIAVLPPSTIPVDVEIVDPTNGDGVPGRVRFVSADGRYLPPIGHRDEINPGFFEDTGGDLILGSAAYAYVPARFSIRLPAGSVEVEVIGGFDRRPYRARVEIDSSSRRLVLPLERILDLHGDRWVTADSHVHFLAPSTALLQAAAEDIDIVNLLAAQWGDLYTNVTDIEWGSMTDPSGRRIVVVGTENRQTPLGHLALLGARRMTGPLASGGPPEGPMAGALDVLLADWADRCRAAGGLTVAAHFPLPYAEIAADIVAGKIEAIETQALSPGLDDPAVVEWYRYLNLGYRLPIVAGTDKMSSEIPIGAVRSYAHLLDDGDLTFESWAAAVRRGRTFVTSGPILELSVDGHEPGDVVRLSTPGRVEVALRARSAQPMITDIEIVVNGRVVAATGVPAATAELALRETIEVSDGSWIAARSRSGHHIESAFATSMAAHTSPVYVDVDNRPMVPAAEDAAVVEQVILGARTWVAELAAVAGPGERARMLGYFDASIETLRRRMRNGSGAG
jgi:hypothetical protein